MVFGLGLLCNALLFVPQVLAVWRKKTDEGHFSDHLWGIQHSSGHRNHPRRLSARLVAHPGDDSKPAELRNGDAADSILPDEAAKFTKLS